MLTGAQIETLRGYFGDRSPTLVPGMCLNEHHRGAACTACTDGCPAAAIANTQGAPQLQPDRCVGCGLCLTACPVEAWRQDAPSERKLVETAAGLSDAQLTVVCALHPHPDRPATPSVQVVRHRRCLAALDLADMLALCDGGDRTVWLDDTPCDTCPLQAAAVLRARVAVANDLLEAYGQAACLELASVSATSPSVRSLPVVDGGQPKLSRRRLFGALRRAQTEHESTPLSARQRLLVALPAVEDAIAVVLPAKAPFAQVSVGAVRCSGCGLCAHFCPTAALAWTVAETDSEDGGAMFALGFHVAACVACPICTLACPEGAIRLTDGVTAAALVEASPPLVTGQLVACRDCGALTAEMPGDSRCHVCRHSAGPVTPLHDGAGLMADLLRRSAPRSAE